MSTTISTTAIKEILNFEFNSYSLEAQNLIAKEVKSALQKLSKTENTEALIKEMLETIVNSYDNLSNFYNNCVKFEDKNGRTKIYTTSEYCNYLVRRDKKMEEIRISDTLYYKFFNN